MKELVILSGKGGTGKTSLAAALAALASPLVVADCDVDAPNLPLLLARDGDLAPPRSFPGRFEMRVDAELCRGCGECETVCRFEAVALEADSPRPLPVFDPFACEGCGLCARICPMDAIAMERRMAGEVRIGAAAVGPLIHASLGIGEENSGQLVSLVRQTAREVAAARGHDLILCDGPPGVGCPVIAAVSHAGFALLVTEPSPAALHDLERTAQLAEQFEIPAAVVLNKSDLHPPFAKELERWCAQRGLEQLASFPYSRSFFAAARLGVPVLEVAGEALRRRFEGLWERLQQRLDLAEFRRRLNPDPTVRLHPLGTVEKPMIPNSELFGIPMPGPGEARDYRKTKEGTS